MRPPQAGLFTAISGGGEHTCGLRSDATVACWGHNSYGQAEAPRGRFIAVAAGGWHTCALRDDRTAECWGLSDVGTPDDDSQVDSMTNTPVTIRLSEVGAPDGDNRSGSSQGACFFHSAHAPAYCWRSAGHEPDGTFSAISAGAIHTCGLRPDATIDCWGHGTAGRIDAPGEDIPLVLMPRPPGPGESVSRPDALDDEAWRLLRWGPLELDPFLCQVRPATSSFYCSVHGDVGQADPPDGTYTAVTAGGWHTCALRNDNTLACWGDNSFGQAHAPDGTHTAVAAGWAHTCALRTDDTIACWGDNTHGQTSPPPGDYTNLTAGGIHTCALRADQTITCWGAPGHVTTPPRLR